MWSTVKAQLDDWVLDCAEAAVDCVWQPAEEVIGSDPSRAADRRSEATRKVTCSETYEAQLTPKTELNV